MSELAYVMNIYIHSYDNSNNPFQDTGEPVFNNPNNPDNPSSPHKKNNIQGVLDFSATNSPKKPNNPNSPVHVSSPYNPNSSNLSLNNPMKTSGLSVGFDNPYNIPKVDTLNLTHLTNANNPKPQDYSNNPEYDNPNNPNDPYNDSNNGSFLPQRISTSVVNLNNPSNVYNPSEDEDHIHMSLSTPKKQNNPNNPSNPNSPNNLSAYSTSSSQINNPYNPNNPVSSVKKKLTYSDTTPATEEVNTTYFDSDHMVVAGSENIHSSGPNNSGTLHDDEQAVEKWDIIGLLGLLEEVEIYVSYNPNSPHSPNNP